jgi:hypothetical protein
MSKMVFSALLLTLLMAWAGACHAQFHNALNHGRLVRHPARVRLRRTSKHHPTRCPFAPQSQTEMPPAEDDDDDSRDQINPAAVRESVFLAPLSEVSPHALLSLSRLRRAPDAPLYQTLGILLI